MRIISNFFDYYDNAMSYGIDKDLIYNRKLEIIEVDKKYKKDEITRFIDAFNPFEVIGFCGRMYPVYLDHTDKRNCKKALQPKLMQKDYNPFWRYRYANTYRAYYSFEEVEANYDPKHSDYSLKRIFDTSNKYWKPVSVSAYREIDNYIGKTISDDIFREYDSPIIHWVLNGDKINITINPMLSNFNFMIKHDPFSAFQEIAMYIGNNLVKQVDPTVNFSDELKRDIAGFDKWSFRKHKEDK